VKIGKNHRSRKFLL